MTERPSYILFITDQQRYDHLGCNGHPVLRTPISTPSPMRA